MGNNEHLTSAEIAEYVDRALPVEEQARVEDHLVECEVCREELVAANRLVRTLPVRRNRRLIGISAATAAAIAAILLLQSAEDITGPRGPLRGGEPQAESGDIADVAAVAPMDRDVVTADSVVFVWRSVESDALYEFTLTDGSGDILWTTSTGDTSLMLGPEAGLRREQQYFWYVDALMSGGRPATSGVHLFRTQP